MRTLNPKHIEAMLCLINDSPYFRLLSLKVCVLAHAYCKLEIDLREKHLNPFGGLHGGVFSSAIDSAAYWASYGGIPEGSGLISVDLHTDNISAVQSGKLIVEGRSIKAGRMVCFSEAAMKSENGKLLARGTSKQLVTDRLQTINHVLEAMGLEALPPKFLD
jgi:uncharacterized protein (TIGR00369 family)